MKLREIGEQMGLHPRHWYTPQGDGPDIDPELMDWKPRSQTAWDSAKPAMEKLGIHTRWHDCPSPHDPVKGIRVEMWMDTEIFLEGLTLSQLERLQEEASAELSRRGK